MKTKVQNLFGFSSEGESPPLGDERGEVDWSGPIEINQMKEFTPKDPRERSMNKKMVVIFEICGTEQTHMRDKKDFDAKFEL